MHLKLYVMKVGITTHIGAKRGSVEHRDRGTHARTHKIMRRPKFITRSSRTATMRDCIRTMQTWKVDQGIAASSMLDGTLGWQPPIIHSSTVVCRNSPGPARFSPLAHTNQKSSSVSLGDPFEVLKSCACCPLFFACSVWYSRSGWSSVSLRQARVCDQASAGD